MTIAAPLRTDHAPQAAAESEQACVAGFFATESEALAVGHDLRCSHGVQATQQVLLSPSQSGWLPFTRRARAWAPGRNAQSRSLAADGPLMALLCGLGLSLAVATWLIVDERIANDASSLVYLLTPVVGASAGWAVATWLAFASQHKRFNSKVRSELAAGRWVVLTHGVRGAQHGSVLDLMRSRAVGWCVMSASRYFL